MFKCLLHAKNYPVITTKLEGSQYTQETALTSDTNYQFDHLLQRLTKLMGSCNPHVVFMGTDGHQLREEAALAESRESHLGLLLSPPCGVGLPCFPTTDM